MARKSPKQLAEENELLRSQVQKLSVAQQSLLRQSNSRSSADLWVGIRNISDNTIHIPSPFPQHEPSVDLHADCFADDPNRVARISYAWWLQLRKGSLVERGLILRDDSILGESYEPAPADRIEDLPRKAHVNAVPDVAAWLADKDETDITAALAEITSEDTLRRLRSFLDVKLSRIQEQYPVDDKRRGQKAYRQLTAKEQFLDNAITQRLERPDDEE